MNLLELSNRLVDLIWGDHLVYLLFAAGIFFTIYFKFPQIRFFKHAVDIVMGKFDKPEDRGEISHFQALCTALSATIGLGNIAGVAIAISFGGPGAVFWMWVAGFIGMATKFTEVTLSLDYRKIVNGKVFGGPMLVMQEGLPKYLAPLSFIYAFCVILSSFGAGNMFQANQMAATLHSSFSIPEYVSGSAFAFLVFLVLIGGIKRIAQVTDKLVPGMIILYFTGAIGLVAMNITRVPEVFELIYRGAFFGSAAFGGFAGAAVKEVMSFGIRRAVFSNEAGMGSAAIAHSAARSSSVQEGLVALLEPFIDTIVVCSVTAFAILLTDSWHTGVEEGVKVTETAFSSLYGIYGQWLVTTTVVLFAFSTIISWSYYGEQATHFLFGGDLSVIFYRIVFIGFVFLGAIAELRVVLNLSDAVFGLLAFPNLLTCFWLKWKVKEQLGNYHLVK